MLAAVFAAARWYWVLLILAAMTAVATQAAVSRLGKPLPGGASIAGIALTVSTAATLAYVIGVVVQVRPWWEPQYIIPIAGMILGNSMTSAALAGDREHAACEPVRTPPRRKPHALQRVESFACAGELSRRAAATSSGRTRGASFPQLERSWLTTAATSASVSCGPNGGITAE